MSYTVVESLAYHPRIVLGQFMREERSTRQMPDFKVSDLPQQPVTGEEERRIEVFIVLLLPLFVPEDPRDPRLGGSNQ